MTPETKSPVREKLEQHFGKYPPESIVTTIRNYAVTSRIDLQHAIEEFFENREQPALFGVWGAFIGDSLSLSQLFSSTKIEIGPLQHDDIDAGELQRTRCFRTALWMSVEGALPYALLLTTQKRMGVSGMSLELAVPKGDEANQFSENFFNELELRVSRGGTYRGKVISLDSARSWTGEGAAIKVHRLHSVTREEVILPEKTLRMVDHNIGDFIRARTHIKGLGMSGKKGLLFYGPPGTGKTHTIYYLASHLEGHTTLLITSEQVALLEDYFRLARMLQPSVVVIEDVDLIAMARQEMRVPGEILLNKLLNEMDGLREDSDVVFILTTNRVQQLEPALASRPGRIDQAIEFALPDDECRSRLIALYGRGLDLPQDLIQSIVRKTRGVSAAFIKELMRRAAQFQFESGAGGTLGSAAVEAAIEEMVVNSGTLNLKLLGGGNAEIGFTRGAK